MGKYSMSKTNKAKDYIKKNFFKKDKSTIVKESSKKLGLKKSTIINLYNEIQQQINISIEDKVVNNMREQREITRYKGRLREFFILDDSNLYKGLIENKKRV